MLERALNLMHWVFYCVSGHDVPSFSDNLIFLVGVETIKNYFSTHRCVSEIGTEIPLFFYQTVVVHENRAIPYVRSTTAYAICCALDLKAQLILIQDINQHIKPALPAAFSFTVFKICEVLELKTELHLLNDRSKTNNDDRLQLCALWQFSSSVKFRT
ncbi:hypothetical protein TNCV_4295731 [Trichonephila clavipes]|nr:hypothetical protein TNCV_4295731 [Trichonephila clavipes]